jgi:hypothetical protein
MVPDSDETRPLPEHAAEFLSTIDVARNTGATYLYALHALAEFLVPGPEAPASSLREDLLVRFRQWMPEERGYGRRAEGTYLAAAIRYLEWLDACSQLPPGLTSARMKLVLKLSRGRRRVGYKTQPIKEAVPLLLRHYDQMPLPEPTSPRARRQRPAVLRNRAVVHTLLAAGLRAQELCFLKRTPVQTAMQERVFKEDILQCASCGGRRKVTAFIPSGTLAREILERLGIDATGPQIAKARARPHQEHFDLHPEDTAWIRSTRRAQTVDARTSASIACVRRNAHLVAVGRRLRVAVRLDAVAGVDSNLQNQRGRCRSWRPAAFWEAGSMGVATFYPWLRLRGALHADKFILVPWRRGDTTPTAWSAADQAALDTILEPYMQGAEATVEEAVVVCRKDRAVLDDLTEQERWEFFDFNQLLTFARLSGRRYFSFAGYANAATFTPVMQGFDTPGRGTTSWSRRRDGRTNHFTPHEYHREFVPEHVSLSDGPKVDESLLRALLAAREAPGWEAFESSIASFNLANSDAPTIPERVESVMMLSAFERLLDSSSRQKDLCDRFVAAFPVTEPVKERPPRVGADLWNKHGSLRGVWMDRLCAVRGSLAHGNAEGACPSSWTLKQHLLLGAFCLPLLAKSKLAAMKLYDLTVEDENHIEAFEPLLAHENLFKPEGSNQWPWWTTIHDAGLRASVARAVEKLSTSNEVAYSTGAPCQATVGEAPGVGDAAEREDPNDGGGR